jgi:hypothetical protein
MALQLRDANTGVLIAHGVRELVWSGPERATSKTAWTIGGSTPSNANRLFGIGFGLWPSPGARLSLTAESAAFFTGNVPDLGDVPPNYAEDDEATVRAALPNWSSPFTPVHAVFLDRAPDT